MSLKRVLIVPDVHVPYHDKRAWALMLKVGREFKPDYLFTIGDLLDFYSVSDHSKDPNRALLLDKEIAAGNAALDELDTLGATARTFISGNHCYRMQRYLQDKAPELFNFVDVTKLLRLKERGWSYVPYRADTKFGKIFLTHDVGAAGRNAVFRALDTYQHSVVTGHTHRMAYIVEGNSVGELKLSAQFGWLGDVNQVDYMHKAKARKDWALGFGTGYLNPKTGIVYLTPIPIVKYSCVVNGKLFEG